MERIGYIIGLIIGLVILFWVAVLLAGVIAPRLGVPMVTAGVNISINNWCAVIDCDVFNTSRPTPAARVGAPVRVAPTATPLPNTQPQPVSTPSAGGGSSQIVVEIDGRIWQPQIRNGNAPYTETFTAPTTGSMTRRFNGVNAKLMDSTGNIVASGGNNIIITLRPGERYTVQGGSSNGGFSLEVQ